MTWDNVQSQCNTYLHAQCVFKCRVHFHLVGLPLQLEERVDLSGTVDIVVSLVEFEVKFKPNAEQEIVQQVALLVEPFLFFQTAVDIPDANFFNPPLVSR